MNPTEYNSVRERLVRAAIGKMKNAPREDKPRSDADWSIVLAKTITDEVREHVRPVLQAGGWKDKEALRDMVTRLYLERFSKATKTELENITTMLHVELFMEGVEAAPWGTGTPDQLSGV